MTQNICLSEGCLGKVCYYPVYRPCLYPDSQSVLRTSARGDRPVPHALSEVGGLRGEPGTTAQLLSGVPTGLVPVCE